CFPGENRRDQSVLMSDKRTGRLSRKVVGLWIVVDAFDRSPDLAAFLQIPEEVKRLALAVKQASNLPEQDQPKVRLNRSLAALRKQQPNLFLPVLGWLLGPD